MFITNSYSLAIFFCVITMLCWGSWANTMKLSPRNWPFQLYYWDYSLGLVLTALLLGLTMGSMGENGRGFLSDLAQAAPVALGSALLGGVVLTCRTCCLWRHRHCRNGCGISDRGRTGPGYRRGG
jgi:glucose uptake protein